MSCYYNEKNPDWKCMKYKGKLYIAVRIFDNSNNMIYAVFDYNVFGDIQEMNKKLFINKNEVSYFVGRKIEKIKDKLDLNYQHYNGIDYDFRKSNLNYDNLEISENKIMKLKREFDLLIKTSFEISNDKKLKKAKPKKEPDFYYEQVTNEELNDIFDFK